ncbi:MAG: hypothetical protein GTO71_06015 [Woeseiaceae bacterium]|nr:hypothetical protein [Woeseiaceae bacterium]NIP20654.1 hypothetical protein [Woeseiaceae bacterium]NIS89447.1 hypothetical protein [Woeseiaceae bacterium]
MRTLFTTIAVVLLAGCAAQDEQEDASSQDIDQAVRDFIELRELESLDALVSGSNDGWREISDYFILYEGRRDTYLVEFVRRCFELRDNTRITPDERWDKNRIRARFDTIRGCRIAAIYALDETEAAEVENIGEAPGSRN